MNEWASEVCGLVGGLPALLSDRRTAPGTRRDDRANAVEYGESVGEEIDR